MAAGNHAEKRQSKKRATRSLGVVAFLIFDV